MGIFDRDIFDFNGDGKADTLETIVGIEMMSSSRKEAMDLVGDDTFYTGTDDADEDDESEDDLKAAGLDLEDFDDLDDDERRDALEDAGLDADDFDEF